MTARQRLAFLGCSFSIGIFGAFNNFTLSLWLTGFTSSHILIALLSNSRSLEGAIVSPLAGVWSDRTWVGWLGRRRPFILVGGLLSGMLLAATPALSRWPWLAWTGVASPEVARLAPIILAIFLFTLTINLMDDVYHALLPDLAPETERNRLAGLMVVVDIGAQVAILVVFFLLWSDHVPDSAFGLAGALVVIGTLVTVLGVREPSPAVWLAERQSLPIGPNPPLSTASRPQLMSRYRGALFLCLVNFAYWSGVSAVLPLVSIYTRDILGASVGEAQLLPALLLLSTALMAIPVGWLGTRYGRRKIMSAGYLIMGAAALSGLFINTREEGAVLFFLAGLGNAATIVLRIPLLAELVPRQHMGIATGALAASGSVAAPLASLLGGALADAYGPRAIFAVMAVMSCLAVALMPGTIQASGARRQG